ncbi:hypothetical protein [Niveispirillum cyanobacteriorum]|uniref:Uncharacterized protein n=1 Tax=Niveispirillum cyanobacteriorum TaxID=1612173 RepID=A0A2K9NHP1_9PROT|nr:hypothetical protein [Niveispirillum cyanobacteriorum]AUN32599.1 hypothetical protein C0V82_19900 [Niveispirillum cyanobacteriorum]
MLAEAQPDRLAAEHCLTMFKYVRTLIWRVHSLIVFRNPPPKPEAPTMAERDLFLLNVPANIRELSASRWAIFLLTFSSALTVAEDSKGAGFWMQFIDAVSSTSVEISLFILGILRSIAFIRNTSLIFIQLIFTIAAALITKLLQIPHEPIALLFIISAFMSIAFWISAWTIDKQYLSPTGTFYWLAIRLVYVSQFCIIMLTIPLFLWLNKLAGTIDSSTDKSKRCCTPGCPKYQWELGRQCKPCEQDGVTSYVRVDRAIDRPYVSICPACCSSHHIWHAGKMKETLHLRRTECIWSDQGCTQDEGHKAIQIVGTGGVDTTPVLQWIVEQVTEVKNWKRPEKWPYRLPLKLAGLSTTRPLKLTVYEYNSSQTLLHEDIPVLLVLPKPGLLQDFPSTPINIALDGLVFASKRPFIWIWWPDTYGPPPGTDRVGVVTNAIELSRVLDIRSMTAAVRTERKLVEVMK